MTDLAPRAADPHTVVTGSSAAADHSEGMSYLETLPRRLVSLYLPLGTIMLVLLFPFYWMALTAIKPDDQLLDMERVSPFWTWSPTFKHIHKLLFDRHHHLDHRERARRLCDRAAALQGRPMGGRRDLPRLSDPALDPVHPAVDRRVPIRSVRHAFRADPHLSDHPHPVLDLADDGLFQDDSLRARGMRADRRRQPLADPHQDHPAAVGARDDLRLHLLLHPVLERVHLRAHLHLLDPEQDGAGRDPQRIRRRRHLPPGPGAGAARPPLGLA